MFEPYFEKAYRSETERQVLYTFNFFFWFKIFINLEIDMRKLRSIHLKIDMRTVFLKQCYSFETRRIQGSFECNFLKLSPFSF